MIGLPACAAEPSLSIVQSGVQQYEDGPFVPKSYQFLPGEDLYFTFEVAGFSIKSNSAEAPRRISLSYEVVPVDANGLPLAPPDVGKIEEELNPEDKTWLPKRSSIFQIPSFVAAGDFSMRVKVKDEFANAEASGTFPFHIGGVKLQPSPTITVENLRFLRAENSREPLELAAYRPGDVVYARFEITGYNVDPQNAYHVSYGLTVFSPDGKTYLDSPKAAELQSGSFYPAQFVPGLISVTTSANSVRGAYTLVLQVHDLQSNRNYDVKQSFQIE